MASAWGDSFGAQSGGGVSGAVYVQEFTSEVKKDSSERSVTLNISSRKTDVESNRYLTALTSNRTSTI